MALPVGVTKLGSFKGVKGDKGRPGTFDTVTAESIPADQPIEADITGDEGQHLHIKVPRGLPGVNAVENDTATAAYIAAPDSETRAQLDPLIAAARAQVQAEVGTQALSRIEPSPTKHMPTTVSLLSGDSASPLALNSTLTVVPGQGYQGSASGLRITAAGGLTSMGARVTLGSPMSIGPAQVIAVAVDIPDVSKVNAITVQINHDSGRTAPFTWTRSSASTPVQNLVNGLNVIRFPAALFDSAFAPNWAATWGKAYFATVSLTRIGGGNIDLGTVATVRNVWAEVQAKAKLIIVADRGYRSWVEGGYPDLKALSVPVTWAPDLDLFATNVGTIFESISEAELHALARENGNSVSFHGKTGGATSGMTAAQLAAENDYCIEWCRRYGYQGRMWRAAYVQNNAAAVEDPLVTAQFIGSAFSTTALTVRDTYQVWPPINNYHIYRQGIEVQASSATNQANMDSWFGRLKVDHGVLCVFFHRLDENDPFSTRQADWDYFVAKVAQGIAEGWLEGVTFEDLYYGSRGNFVQTNGVAKSHWEAKPLTRYLK